MDQSHNIRFQTIVCYGDSNTFGYDPRGFFGGRYDEPWTLLLARATGWDIRNNGMNGRMIPRRQEAFPKNADRILVMLGTNDLLQGASAAEAADRMEAFLNTLDPHKVFLLAPPPMVPGAWVPDGDLIERSEELAARYRALARKMNIAFADAGQWDIPLCFDGVHFTEEGHRRFADALIKELAEGVHSPDSTCPKD